MGLTHLSTVKKITELQKLTHRLGEILISPVVIWFHCVTTTPGTLPQAHISTRYWILNNKWEKWEWKAEKAFSSIIENCSSREACPPWAQGSPNGPSPLILRKALVHCFSQPSRSLQRDSLRSHVLATPFCLAILAESWGRMLLRIRWAATQGGPHTFHCVMGSSGSLFSPLSSSV